MTVLHLACKKGDIEMVRRVLMVGEDVNSVTYFTGRAPIHSASNYGHANIVSLLINQGANVNLADKIGVTPLCLATYQGNVKVVKLLIANGADPNRVGFIGITPLELAIQKNHTVIMVMLIRNVLLKNLTPRKPNYVEENEKASRMWDDILLKNSTFNCNAAFFQAALQEVHHDENHLPSIGNH